MNTTLAIAWLPWGEGVWGQALFFADISLRMVLLVVIVSRKRPVPITLAWLVLVLAVPLVGSFMYLWFGAARLGSRRLEEYRVLTTEIEPLAVATWWEQKLTARAPFTRDGAFDPVAKDAAALGGFPPLVGNRLTLIGNTDELLRRIIGDIDQATTHVHMLFYIWMDGGLASEVVEALIRAARRGVDCKVLADSIGSKRFLKGSAPVRLREAGVQMYEALPAGILYMFTARIDLRNHRKIVVIDGRIAYCGSQNLTDTTYHFRKRRHLGPWIDASVRMEGPAVQALAVTFLRDWAMEEDAPVTLDERYLPSPVPKDATPGTWPPADGAVVQVVPTGPGPDVNAMREPLLTAIYAARHELVITTPYFVPDEPTLAAILGAARRGIAVTIVVPRLIDSKIVAIACQSHFEELLNVGVRVMWHREGMLHSKAMTIDGDFSMIGSANIDMRSFFLNFEVTLFVYNNPFSAELRALQERYIQDSDQINATVWMRRSILTRSIENIVRLFGAVM